MPLILNGPMKDSELLQGRALGQTWTRENKTEAYVCIPPALIITDSNGATWTIGSSYIEGGYWAFYYNVLRNDVDTDIFAAKIEYRGGKIRALTKDGWRVWTERRRGSMSAAPGYWL